MVFIRTGRRLAQVDAAARWLGVETSKQPVAAPTC